MRACCSIRTAVRPCGSLSGGLPGLLGPPSVARRGRIARRPPASARVRVRRSSAPSPPPSPASRRCTGPTRSPSTSGTARGPMCHAGVRAPRPAPGVAGHSQHRWALATPCMRGGVCHGRCRIRPESKAGCQEPRHSSQGRRPRLGFGRNLLPRTRIFVSTSICEPTLESSRRWPVVVLQSAGLSQSRPHMDASSPTG